VHTCPRCAYSGCADDFGKLFDGFEREAFRLETLPTYTIPGEQETLRAFLAGEPQPDAHKNAPRVETVRGNARAGKRMYRVRVLRRPLTDYLRYELAWGYHRNQAAGEDIFVLDVTEQPHPLAGLPDFWLFDGQTAVTMAYSETGEFLGAELQPDRTEEYIRHRDTALRHAEPFSAWWERHGGNG
jgi:hypothetical protein